MVGGYQILGGVEELDTLITVYKIDEIIVTAHLSEASKAELIGVAEERSVILTEWLADEIPFSAGNSAGADQKVELA